MSDSEDDKELEEIRAKKMEKLKAGQQDTADWPKEPITITESNFEEIVNKYPKLVIDCWAEWCGPCRMVAPVFDELAKENQGDIAFGRLNTDENQGIAMKFNIMSIPTFLVFKDGELIGRPVGAMPKPALEAALKDFF